MTNSKGELSSGIEAIDLILEVKELRNLNSLELFKLLKDSENLAISHITENGSPLQIDLDKLGRFLPLHLTAVLLSGKRDEPSLRYLLYGLRLLYSLCETASRHPKLEQILLDDLKVSEQLLDFVFHSLIFSASGQGCHLSGYVPLLYSALVACSMYLLTACISSQWFELAYVLLAHPKVDLFIDAAFAAVRRNIKFLQIKLSAQESCFSSEPSLAAEKVVYNFCLQCEASTQFLQSLCQHKSFRERLLKNKELCRKGGVLRLVQATLKLDISPTLKQSLTITAAVSRLKARALSILLQLCEAESVSYLDEVASVPESLNLAKAVAAEVIGLFKTVLSQDLKPLDDPSGKIHPTGLLLLNALRLADIFSDDSNFRSYITAYFTEVLAAILSMPYPEFLSSWCSSELPEREEDALLDYEPFTMTGWILGLSSTVIDAEPFEPILTPTKVTQSSYAHQRSSLLVKVIANLHCFVPNICKEKERNFFLHKFIEHLKLQWKDLAPSQLWTGFSFRASSQIAAAVCKNLRSLLGHATSLVPAYLNEEDVHLLRVFFTQLQSLIGPDENNGVQSPTDACSPAQGTVDLDLKVQISNLREGMSENTAFPGLDSCCIQDDPDDEADGARRDANFCQGTSGKTSAEVFLETEKELYIAETSGSDSGSTKRKNPRDHVDHGLDVKVADPSHNDRSVTEDVKIEGANCEEKHVRKRRRVLNEEQVSVVETALLEDPDVSRNAALLQSLVDRLSSRGSEVTLIQLKNWLSNRRAKLARAARDVCSLSAKDVCPLPAYNHVPLSHRQDGSSVLASFGVLTVPPTIDLKDLSCRSSLTTPNQSLGTPYPENTARLHLQNSFSTPDANRLRLAVGQAVVLTDPQGKEMAKGRVYQLDGEWSGCNLAGSGTCVVDITKLKAERVVRLPQPSLEDGATFEDAEAPVENIKVLWQIDLIRFP